MVVNNPMTFDGPRDPPDPAEEPGFSESNDEISMASTTYETLSGTEVGAVKGSGIAIGKVRRAALPADGVAASLIIRTGCAGLTTGGGRATGGSACVCSSGVRIRTLAIST